MTNPKSRMTSDRMSFYTTSKIGELRSTTPEGFLVCHSVPIARTGVQLYLSSEVPLEDAGNGEVRVTRTPEEVFRIETIASFEGKAVTVEHPNDFVTPENWKQLSIGIVQNVRQGEGLQDDLLIADLVITDQKAIEYVNKELPEVSAGYEASYEQIEPGYGVQRDIVGNHVALVERGRAGSRCSIQDSIINKEIKMKTKRTIWDRLSVAVKAKDEEAVKAELEENQKERSVDEGGDDTAARLDRLEAAVSKLVESLTATDEASEIDPDKKEEATDEADPEGEQESEVTDEVLDPEEAEHNTAPSAAVISGDSLKKVAARAEILSPGVKLVSKDKAAERQEIDAFMRSTLIKAYATDSGKEAIAPFLSGREIKDLTKDALASVFIGSAELMRVKNNAAAGRSSAATKDFGSTSSAADINARNREFWANRR